MPTENLITLSDSEVTSFLLAVILLLCSAHFFGYLFERYSLPRVIGEIVGGLVLGPTVLGYFLPAVYQDIFNAFPSEGKMLSGIYWLGLILLMFISGFEMKNSIEIKDRIIIISLLIGGTLIPFIAGWLFSITYNISSLMGDAQDILALQIIISIAVAVTSIPVISKIFIDLGIIETRFAQIVIATATIEDVALYVALSVATGVVVSEYVSLATIGQTVLLTILFLFIGLAILPGVYRFILKSKFNFLVKSSVLAFTLLTALTLTVLASLLKVNVIFGALIAGLVVGSQSDPRFTEVKAVLRQFSLAFFIPIYFAVVGLKLDLVRHFDPYFFLGFLIFAVAFKSFGTIVAARVVHLNWLSSLNLGFAMNPRGGPGIVLATIAYDSGIINESFFASLIMLAIVTSLVAGYWFKMILNRKLELLS